MHFDGLFLAVSDGAVPRDIVRLVATDQLPGWAFSFALGMTGAWAYAELRRRGRLPSRLRRRASVWALPALLAYALFAYLYGRESREVPATLAGSFSRESPWLALGSSASRAALMAAIALGPAWLLWPFVNRPVRRLGDLSFGLYLMHVSIGLYAAAALGLPRDGGLGTVGLWCVAVFPASLVYAYASLRLVERPARRWGRGFEQREVAATWPAAASAGAALSERRGAEARG